MDYMDEGSLPHWQQFTIGMRRIKAGHHRELNFHNHHFSEIVLVQKSENVIHWAEGKSCVLHRGDILLLPPGRVHGYENCKSLALVNLLYKADRLPLPLLDGAEMTIFPSLISAKCAAKLSSEKPLLSLDEKNICRIEKNMTELEKELNGDLPGRNLRAFIIFMDILSLLGRAGKSEYKDHKINPAMAAVTYLNMHFRDPLSVPQLARVSHLSKRSLYRRFHELTGMTPGDYCRFKQLEYAADLLRSNTHSLSDIAFECGFCDSNYLIKQFSRRFGMTPGKFRQKYKPDCGSLTQNGQLEKV